MIFRKALTDRTKLVAIAHMSNVLGTVVDVKEVCRIAHERGVKVLIDGSQAAVHMPVDVQDIDCDWYVMTGHKLYGPSGIGVLYGKTDALNAMQPFMGGGEMIVDVSEDAVTYNDPPHRFEAGTPPIVQASVWARRSSTWKSSVVTGSRHMKPISRPMRSNGSRRSTRSG
jgi:cysteine desulfurase/selenocysteine lyase